MRSAIPYALHLLAALALFAQPGAAQLRFDGIDASAGYFGWGGADFKDVEAGPRFAIAPMVRIGELWSVGIEGESLNAELQLQRNPIFIDGIGVGGIVRRNFADPSGPHLFVGVRGGWSKLSSEQENTDDGTLLGSWSQTGWTAGAEAGVGFPAGQYIHVVWAVGYGHASYGQCEVFGPEDGVVSFGDACSATRWGVRIGIVIGRDDG